MQYFQNFEYEIKINIFKYVDSPLNLALTCRNWSVIAKDPYAKSEWLIVHFGKERALFHAVRLGPTFFDMSGSNSCAATSCAVLKNTEGVYVYVVSAMQSISR